MKHITKVTQMVRNNTSTPTTTLTTTKNIIKRIHTVPTYMEFKHTLMKTAHHSTLSIMLITKRPDYIPPSIPTVIR